jgi:hypothetical protein
MSAVAANELEAELIVIDEPRIFEAALCDEEE